MKKIYFLCFLFFFAAQAKAQQKSTFITGHGGWGTETNMGFYGGFGGMGIEKEWTRKLSLAAGVSYFKGHGDRLFTNEDENYQALFFAPNVAYHLAGNQQSFSRLTVAAGPALKWFQYKRLETGTVHMNPDGSETLTSARYETANTANFSLYASLNLSFDLSPKIRTALFLDTYSHEILLEHFMPGIKLNVRL